MGGRTPEWLGAARLFAQLDPCNPPAPPPPGHLALGLDHKSHVTTPREVPNYQLLMLGEHYYEDGPRVLYEEFARPGDVLLYNGQTLHGVQTVDPYTPVDLDSAAGRYSASVTLYRVYRREMSMG